MSAAVADPVLATSDNAATAVASSPAATPAAATANGSGVSIDTSSAAAAPTVTGNGVGGGGGEVLSPGATLRAVRELQHERKKSMVHMDGWIEVQERTFLRWTNFQLSRGRHAPLADLRTGFSSGVALCALVEVLAKQPLPARPNRLGTSQVVHLDNLRIVFNFLEKQPGMHLVNIRPADIEQGNLKIVLGLVWSLIQKYTIVEAARASPSPPPPMSPVANSNGVPEQPTAAAAAAATGSQESSAKAELLAWVNAQIAPFSIDDKPVGTATDFTRSWQDGRVLTALVESLDTSVGRNESLRLPVDGNGVALGALAVVEAALKKAESSYSIPPLMDAMDIAHRPQEHSLMTYVALLREAATTRAEEAALAADLARAEANSNIDIIVPLSPIRVLKVEQSDETAPTMGAVQDHETPKDEDDDAVGKDDKHDEDEVLSPEELAAMAERTRAGTHHALVGAFIDSASIEAAVSPGPKAADAALVALPPEEEEEPFDSELAAKKDAESAPVNIQHVEADLGAAAAAALTPAATPASAPEPAPVGAADKEDYSEEAKEDAEGKLPHETLQQSIDRRIEKLLGAIEICVVTPEHKYLQSDVNGLVRANEVNTAAATWQILDGVGGWKFLRDFQSRYLAADSKGKVYTSNKQPECRWKIVRGVTQYFVSSHGQYLTVAPGASATAAVKTQVEKSEGAKFKICFPVVEGVLQKKGTSGLHRWQERYFAFNGSVMSYWRKKSEVGKERPNGIWHPVRMQSVNINRQSTKRFNIVFIDGKIVELLAPSMEEAIRWTRALNSRGIKTVQQTKRMSTVADTTQPAGTPMSAPVANPLEAAAAAAAARYGKQ